MASVLVSAVAEAAAVTMAETITGGIVACSALMVVRLGPETGPVSVTVTVSVMVTMAGTAFDYEAANIPRLPFGSHNPAYKLQAFDRENTSS
ncbi:hypothetical protein BDZ91DRAFT_802455 [Kalaharituber pfeilii]|nr:hypothetical protein BDZ91DRAFT_802455 [Kalaharituber pfeilii]